MLLSACMIVKNEALVLRASLESLRGHADEIIVVDNGSTDDSVEIARSAGAIVVSEEGDFSALRNRALREAHGEHRLMIDADEVVRQDTWDSLRAFIRDGSHALGRILVISDTVDGVASEWITRLCTADPRFHYEGAIHERLVGPGSVGNTGLAVLHSGYTPQAIARKGSIERNLRLLRLEIEHRPQDAYMHYQLGKTLLVAKRAPEAVGPLREALRLMLPDAAYAPALACDLGYALRDSGASAEALAVVRRFHESYADYTDLFFLEGLCHMDLGDSDAMVRAFERCLELGESPLYCTVRGVGSYRAHYNLGLFHELAGDPCAARRHYEQALASSPTFALAAKRLRAL